MVINKSSIFFSKTVQNILPINAINKMHLIAKITVFSLIYFNFNFIQQQSFLSCINR